MCLTHVQMVMLLIPPTAQMDCQSSHWKPFQECAYPKSSREKLSAFLSTKPILPYTSIDTRSKNIIEISLLFIQLSRRDTAINMLKSLFCSMQIKWWCAYRIPFTQGSQRATTSLLWTWTNSCPEEAEGLCQGPCQSTHSKRASALEPSTPTAYRVLKWIIS